ncbi:MAG: DUF4974 domain-containing protein [Candidatus Pseudobacter hemicellulosilyticus]|uniref:DUF4974 domain-containing protein n=1 Tax=Candidatus Pseudobacter hemicellulosilyticus TaxID=3121375 RepID=A0AAJ6BJ38_9BACT|nr:MAG: DUF4974 domain-containing protein [Pseudobacter sp.]
MLYQNYNTEDFLQDSSFRQYCAGTSQECVQFWEDWLRAHPEKKDEVAAARQLYALLSGGVTARSFRAHRRVLEQKLAGKGWQDPAGTEAVPRRTGRLNRAWYWAAAASLAGLTLIAVLRKAPLPEPEPVKNLVVFASEPGEKKEIRLPDGSKVLLNVSSRLELYNNFNTGTRELYLDGEAFFDVVDNPSVPFIVHSKRFDVTVLGTTFNVRSYDNDKKSVAALIQGKIGLTFSALGNSRKLVLAPAQQIVIEDGEPGKEEEKQVSGAVAKRAATPSTVSVTPLQVMSYDSSVVETSWTENRLVFNNESFEEVARKLERWFNVTIIIEDEKLKQVRYTGSFEKENLQSIIDILKLSKPFQYHITDDQRLHIRQ